jgi:hypothetical protein
MKTQCVRAAGAALLLLGVFAAVETACGKDSAASTARVSTPRIVGSIVTAGPHVDGSHYTIDAATVSDCQVGANCAISVKLAVSGEYHVNQQYPYKFTAAQSGNVTYLGTDAAGPNVFTKTAGDFAIADEKSAAMTLKFKITQKGPASVGGTFKLSVCSSQNCLLEQQDVSVNVIAK